MWDEAFIVLLALAGIVYFGGKIDLSFMETEAGKRTGKYKKGGIKIKNPSRYNLTENKEDIEKEYTDKTDDLKTNRHS